MWRVGVRWQERWMLMLKGILNAFPDTAAAAASAVDDETDG